MHEIIEALDQDNFDLFSQLINQHPDYINIKDSEGWSLLTLAIDYENERIVNFLLDNMKKEDINNQTPYHPLQLAIDNNSYLVYNLINHDKIDLQYKTHGNDNFLHLASVNIEDDKKDIIPLLISKGLDPFENNNSNQSAVLLSIIYKKGNVFDYYHDLPQFNSYYDDLWIKHTIKNNDLNLFEKLLPYSTISHDELFNNASGFEHICILDSIIYNGDLIPGQKQITEIIELMCRKYDNEDEEQASLRLADFLFSIKVPFNRFVNAQGQSAWMLSVYNDNEKIFEKLVETNESVNIVDDAQYTPLFYAIQKQNLKFVKSILSKNANLAHVDRNGSTALIQAVRYGNLDIVKEILKYPNVMINEINKNEETALAIAVHRKRIDIVTELLWAGAEISKHPAKFIEENSIYQISLNGNYEKAHEEFNEVTIDNFIALSKIGLRLNAKNNNGDNFLLHFIKEGYLANFKAALKCAFDPNEIDSNGDSVLMCAMKKTHNDYALGILWKYGSKLDYSITNKQGLNIYDLASSCENSERVITLIRNDNNIDLNKFKKVLPVIISFGNLEKEKESLDYFEENKDKTFNLVLNIENLKDINNNDALMLAVINNNYNNYSWILKNTNIKIDKNHTNSDGDSLISLINNLSDEDKEQYLEDLTFYVKNKKKALKD